MIKLDDNLLVELGLGGLVHNKPERDAFLRHMYETLEMRVGTRLAERMSDQQMSEFEQFINGNDEQGAFHWLESNFPNYKEVVAEEFEKLKAEIRPLASQIAAASQAQMPPQAQPSGASPNPQQMQMDAGQQPSSPTPPPMSPQPLVQSAMPSMNGPAPEPLNSVVPQPTFAVPQPPDQAAMPVMPSSDPVHGSASMPQRPNLPPSEPPVHAGMPPAPLFSRDSPVQPTGFDGPSAPFPSPQASDFATMPTPPAAGQGGSNFERPRATSEAQSEPRVDTDRTFATESRPGTDESDAVASTSVPTPGQPAGPLTSMPPAQPPEPAAPFTQPLPPAYEPSMSPTPAFPPTPPMYQAAPASQYAPQPPSMPPSPDFSPTPSQQPAFAPPAPYQGNTQHFGSGQPLAQPQPHMPQPQQYQPAPPPAAPDDQAGYPQPYRQ